MNGKHNITIQKIINIWTNESITGQPLMFLLQRSLWMSDTSLRGPALPNLKIQLFSQSFYVCLRKQEELNSWILRLGIRQA